MVFRFSKSEWFGLMLSEKLVLLAMSKGKVIFLVRTELTKNEGSSYKWYHALKTAHPLR